MKIFLFLFLMLGDIYAFSYIITTSELNENIEKKFPLEKKFLFSKFIFSEPKLQIDEESNLILFSSKVENPSFVLKDGSVPVFTIYAKSSIKYDGKNIYLQKIKIEKIENEHLSHSLQKKFIIASELLLNIYFSKKPIYKLEDASLSLQTANTMISDVIIQNGVIEVLILE